VLCQSPRRCCHLYGLKLSVGILALVAVLAWPTFVRADVVVVPNSLTAAEGNANLSAGGNLRVQQVYGASQFSGLGVIQITGLAFRPGDISVAAFGPTTLPDLEVHLSTTSHVPDGLSPIFAANVGPDDTTVFHDDWSRSSANAPGPGGTRAFDILLPFTTPFTYDPAAGNLLVDFIGNPGGTFLFLFPELIDAHHVTGDSVSLIVAEPASSPTGIPFVSVGVVTQFAFQPAVAPVPEPATWILFGLGLTGVVARAWRLRAEG
jgi:hypothetical protein